MQQAIEIAFTGDADVDCMCGVIAHHAIARVVIKHADLGALASEIIAPRGKEISQMRDCLARQPHEARP